MSTIDKPTIFVIDDDVAVRVSLSNALTARGYRVDAYESATAFLDASPRARPGCLVLDVRMPDMSGMELQERLRRSGIRLPIIFATGHGDIPMSVRAMKRGAIDFLEKPYAIEVLLERIEEAVAADLQTRRVEERARRIGRRMEQLTDRERTVFDHLTSGGHVSNKDVARALGISHRTVEVHRARIMRKMGAKSLADLVEMADSCRQHPSTR
jgi:two-component system response regulator FixJ